MNIIRKQTISLDSPGEFRIGDQIGLGKYTATCQKVTDKGAIFLLDQYLDKAYQMNSECTNKGGYAASELRQNLKKDFDTDPNFDGIRDYLMVFDQGDLVRIPTVGEFFGNVDWCVMDYTEQWKLMKDRRNRIASREGEEYEWGWLQNMVEESAANFANVTGYGRANYHAASNSFGVRPVFMLGKANLRPMWAGFIL